MRRRLEKRGFEFNTDNDSELIAVYLADKLDKGSPLADALETSIQDLDGTFSFLVSTRDEIGYAKDGSPPSRWSCTRTTTSSRSPPRRSR